MENNFGDAEDDFESLSIGNIWNLTVFGNSNFEILTIL